MQDKLKKIREDALAKILDAKSVKDLDEIRISYMGKKGALTQILRGMGKLSPEERPVMGQLANEVREAINLSLNEKIKTIEEAELAKKLIEDTIDVTLPGNKQDVGGLHPLTIVLNRIKEIFLGMGFNIEEGPEVELDYYNFEALNMPKNHPARDTQDTFYINENILLRTHTSPTQIRVMEEQNPPIKIIVPGRVYRSDAVDATHSPIFHQIEGLVIDENISMGDLKGVLDVFAKSMLGSKTETRFRPHHFPFTEPSAEMDVSCVSCAGEGCRICSYTGWIEIMGAGMVHPKVLEYGNIDPDKYSGFAFGMGLDRIANQVYEIDDIRLLFENDKRFLKQF